jgi:hypothetical protein
MYHYQKRLLEEAAKYGKTTPQKVEETANVRESWAIGSGPMTVKDAESFLDDIESAYKKNGLSGTVSTGIDKITVADMLGEVAAFFSDQPKNTMRLVVRELKKIISPADQGKLKGAFNAMKSKFGESVEVEGETLKEGGVKAALEDFMYDLPKAAIADLKKIGMGDPKKTFNVPKSVGFGRDHKQVMGPNNTIINNIERVLQKHKIPLQFMGSPTWKIIFDYFDTFHGESVEEGFVVESIDTEMAKRRFGSFQYKKSSKPVSGADTEFVLHGVKEGELRSIFGAPRSSGGMKQWSFEHDRPLEHRFTVEFDGNDAYINSSRKGNPTVKDHLKGMFGLMKLRVTTESVDQGGEAVSEAKEKFLTGPGKKDPTRLLGIYTTKGKWIKDMNSEKEAAAFVNKSWGESVEEGFVMEEANKIKLVKEMGSKTLYQYGSNYYIVSYSSVGGETAIFMADSSGKPKSYESLWSERRSVDHDSAMKDFVKYKFKKDAVVEAIEEATVGYALVVDNKIVYRGNKQSCLKLAKEKHGGLKQGKVFITYTPKEVGDTFAKEEVEITEQLANYRAFHMKTGQQITVQASSTKEAEAKAVVALKASSKKSVFVRYLGPVKEEVDQIEGEDIKENATVAQQKKNTYEAREAQAKEIAAKILQVAKERGVRVYTDGQRVVSATKEFPKGDIGAFNKAYNDCGMVLTHMRFTKNSNQWGCESAGFGIGAQECVKAGRAQQHKSGDGGSLIIKFLKR